MFASSFNWMQGLTGMFVSGAHLLSGPIFVYLSSFGCHCLLTFTFNFRDLTPLTFYQKA